MLTIDAALKVPVKLYISNKQNHLHTDKMTFIKILVFILTLIRDSGNILFKQCIILDNSALADQKIVGNSV